MVEKVFIEKYESNALSLGWHDFVGSFTPFAGWIYLWENFHVCICRCSSFLHCTILLIIMINLRWGDYSIKYFYLHIKLFMFKLCNLNIIAGSKQSWRSSKMDPFYSRSSSKGSIFLDFLASTTKHFLLLYKNPCWKSQEKK